MIILPDTDRCASPGYWNDFDLDTGMVMICIQVRLGIFSRSGFHRLTDRTGITAKEVLLYLKTHILSLLCCVVGP